MGVFRWKSLMSIVINFASGVDTTLLKMSLAVVKSAVGELTLPSYVAVVLDEVSNGEANSVSLLLFFSDFGYDT
jgi:hypothetical protein